MSRKSLLWVTPIIFTGVFALVLLLYSPLSDANPNVRWTPSSLYASLAAGESTTSSATFIPSANATNVTVWVVPSLAPYVSVSPMGFSSVQKGTSYQVEVTMAVPVNMVVGAYDGTIQLRQGNRTLAQPLPVVMEVVWPTFDGGVDLGFSLQYPPGWYVAKGEVDATFSNVLDPSSMPDEDRAELAFLRVLVRYEDNPHHQSVQDWFDGMLRPLIEDRFEGSSLTTVAGHEALQVTLSGIGETRTNIYLVQGTDVFEISYGDYAPQYLNTYMSIVDSLRLVP